MVKQKNSTKDWLPVEDVEENGLIKLKNKLYVKLIKIIPVNFNLKSNIEKEVVLESYKNFLKSCDFDIQIIIQSKKENLLKNIINIKNNYKNENKKIINLCEEYVNYIEYINSENMFYSKNYFILTKYSKEEIQDTNKLMENQIKVREGLIKCGNVVVDNLGREEVKNILNSFFNPI